MKIIIDSNFNSALAIIGGSTITVEQNLTTRPAEKEETADSGSEDKDTSGTDTEANDTEGTDSEKDTEGTDTEGTDTEKDTDTEKEGTGEDEAATPAVDDQTGQDVSLGGDDSTVSAGDGSMNMEIGGGDMGMETVKDPFLASWPAVIGISGATILVGLLIGFLFAKRKIKKGYEIYED